MAAGPHLALHAKEEAFDDLPAAARRAVLATLAVLLPSRGEAICLEHVERAALLPRAAREETRELAAELLGDISVSPEVEAALLAVAGRKWRNNERIRGAAQEAAQRIARRRAHAENVEMLQRVGLGGPASIVQGPEGPAPLPGRRRPAMSMGMPPAAPRHTPAAAETAALFAATRVLARRVAQPQTPAGAAILQRRLARLARGLVRVAEANDATFLGLTAYRGAALAIARARTALLVLLVLRGGARAHHLSPGAGPPRAHRPRRRPRRRGQPGGSRDGGSVPKPPG